jgi:large subunit ribosomal protein L17
MRHQLKKHNLNSKRGKSRMIMRNIVTSLVLHERIITTKSRAKSAQSIISKLMTFVKRNNQVNSIRKLNSYMLDTNASKKVMDVLIDKYQDRASGFTRVKKEGLRPGDGAMKYSIEFI